MVFGQLATTLFVRYVLNIDLPVGWIMLGPALVGASNLWLAARLSRPEVQGSIATSTIVAWIFVLDIVCLTGLLMLSGGPTNPFSLLYLVQITLSAIILTKRWTWFLGVLSTLCFGVLFGFYRPIPALEMHAPAGGANLHLIGMWIGFAVAAFLVAMFSGKISELLRQREDSLLRMQEELARKDRLASLVTLAAGAAHEMNTPLGTIAVVAHELERFAKDSAIAEDCRLIRTEVERCREILWRMSIQGAEPAGQASEAVEVDQLLDDVCREIHQPDRVHVEMVQPLPGLSIPRRAVEQAIIALVKNGLEASPSDSVVQVVVRRAGDFLQFVIADRGKGMSQETLRRVGEPFFTTKEPGKGMGLGTFLVRALADQLGGRLQFESSEPSGTSAILELPCHEGRAHD
jgi:two-component system sensor histidine kinase RegB